MGRQSTLSLELKHGLTGLGIPIIKIRRYIDCLIFVTELTQIKPVFTLKRGHEITYYGYAMRYVLVHSTCLYEKNTC